jgi:hypothetical protein
LVERTRVLILIEIVIVREVVNGRGANSPVIEVIEETEAFALGQLTKEIFKFLVVWLFSEFKASAVLHVLLKLDWAIAAEFFHGDGLL